MQYWYNKIVNTLWSHSYKPLNHFSSWLWGVCAQTTLEQALPKLCLFLFSALNTLSSLYKAFFPFLTFCISSAKEVNYGILVFSPALYSLLQAMDTFYTVQSTQENLCKDERYKIPTTDLRDTQERNLRDQRIKNSQDYIKDPHGCQPSGFVVKG